MKGSTRENSGQIHTLEGFTAAFIVLFALLYGVQAIAITPTSSSTASQEVEQHNYKMVGDLLDMSKSNGELKNAVLMWQNGSSQFAGSIRGEMYYSGKTNQVPGGFGDSLSILDERGLAYNVDVICEGNEVQMVRNGEPSLNAVTASTTLQLFEDDDTSGGEELGDLEDQSLFLNGCSNVDEGKELYNIVEVKITAWRQ